MSRFWVGLFEQYKDRYVKANPKRGKFIDNYFRKNGLLEDAHNYSFLELAAFSAKDSLYLKEIYAQADFYISDLEFEILRAAPDGLKFSSDVFSLPLRENSVDVSFHSGLIIYFDNKDVKRIIDSQSYVTSKYSFSFGHNKYNFVDFLVAFFKYRVVGDPLYGYRRFSARELYGMFDNNDCLSVEVYYHDNMIENISQRLNSSLLKFMSRLSIFKLPCFYNEVALIVKKKCAG